MKIPFAQTASFLQKPNWDLRGALFFGPDHGLVRERADMLAKKIVADINDPFAVTIINGASLDDAPGRLGDEMAALSMMGGRRLVWIKSPLEGNAAPLASFLDNPPATDSFLIIEAGDLGTKSKLRSLADKHNLMASVGCYVEEGRDLEATVSSILGGLKIKIDRMALSHLCAMLPPDRIAMRGEVEKLALYVHGKNEVTIDDIHALMHDTAGAEVDDLVMAIASGEKDEVIKLLDRLKAEQTSPIAILRGAQRYFLRLQFARYFIDQGMSASGAVDALQPKVFWKQKDPMVKQLQKWSAGKIQNALKKLLDAEGQCKKTGIQADTICAQTLLGLTG